MRGEAPNWVRHRCVRFEGEGLELVVPRRKSTVEYLQKNMMEPISSHASCFSSYAWEQERYGCLVFSMATPTALSSMHEIIGHGGPSKMQPHLSSRNLRGWLHPGLCLDCSSHVARGHPCRASIGSSWQISLKSNMEEEGTVVYFKVKENV